MAMDTRLLLTLSLEGAGEGSGLEEGDLDAFMAGLVADLNDIEAVSAALASAEESEPGSKALGTFLLGVLTAEVNGENAMKVIRYLKSVWRSSFDRLLHPKSPGALTKDQRVGRGLRRLKIHRGKQ